MATIIGIGGPSEAGKSTLARAIQDRLSDRKVLILEMDKYVLPEKDIPTYRGLTDWEHPESVDYEGLIHAIKEHQDMYELIIVEGILIYANEELLSFFDCTILIDITKETYLKRRHEEVRWGDEPEWYLEHVWDAWQTHGQYPNADFVVSGEEELNPDAILPFLSNEN